MSNRQQLLFVGDSITQGYGDDTGLSKGVPGGLMLQLLELNSDPIYNATNLGRSGYNIAQYLPLGKAYIAADPTSITAAIVSIWTPNVPVEQQAWYAVDPAVLAVNKALLIAMEAFCLANSVVFIPVFWAGSPFNLAAPHRAALQAYIDDLKLLWPWLINANTVIQDPAAPEGPRILYPDYTNDSTHPNPAGYALLLAKFKADYPAAFAAASLAYGFSP